MAMHAMIPRPLPALARRSRVEVGKVKAVPIARAYAPSHAPPLNATPKNTPLSVAPAFRWKPRQGPLDLGPSYQRGQEKEMT